MSHSPDRNIWIPSRVPQTLPCTDCGRTSRFIALHQPDHYEYSCTACHTTKMLTLSQINEMESSRFHKLPAAMLPITSGKFTHQMKS
jgi:hypothetical protein